jgi:hypothetical protein
MVRIQPSHVHMPTDTRLGWMDGLKMGEMKISARGPQIGPTNANEIQGLPRRQHITVSRLRMGYTNITHGYKIRDELKPHCEECDQEVTVEHLIWQCTPYNSQRRRNSITKDLMGDNKEETGRLIKYLKETGLLYSI